MATRARWPPAPPNPLHPHPPQVSAALVDALRKSEHLPAILADLAAASAAATGGDDRLGRELLACIARADAADYDADAGAAKACGAFVVELAERLPRAVAAGFAPLAAHLLTIAVKGLCRAHFSGVCGGRGGGRWAAAQGGCGGDAHKTCPPAPSPPRSQSMASAPPSQPRR